MKRFIFLLISALVLTFAASCTSCSNGEDQFGIMYSLESEGKTDGFVDLAFISGKFNINGDASYTFSIANDLKLGLSKDAKNLNDALKSDDIKTLDAALKVNDWLEDAIKVTNYEGHYDIYVRGYVMETMTHIKFEIDRHFTNNQQEK